MKSRDTSVIIGLVIVLSLFLVMTPAAQLFNGVVEEQNNNGGSSGSVVPSIITGGSSSGLPQDIPLNLPQGVLYYVPFNISNQQSVSTSNPFNQEIAFDSNLFSNYEAENLQNVEWFTYHGTIIPSWIEHGNFANSSDTVYWLKLPFSVPAHSFETIFMGFVDIGKNLFSKTGNEGYSPQLSKVYGEYDNGAVVFSDGYWNFAGTSLPSGWTWTNSQSPQGSSEVNNGIQFNFPGTWWYTRGVATTSDANHAGYTLYTYQRTTNYNSMNTIAGELTSYGGSVQGHGYQSVVHGYFVGAQSSNFFLEYAPGTNNPGTTIQQSVLSPETNYWYLTSESWPATGQEYADVSSPPAINVASLSGSDTQDSSSSTYLYLGIYDNYGGGGTTYYRYAFLATTPPKNIMPSFSIGTAISCGDGYAGNSAIYMSSGVPQTQLLSDISSVSQRSVHNWPDNGGYNYWTVNGVSIASGQGIGLNGGSIYSLNEVYDSAGSGIGNLIVYVPVTVAGSSITYNETLPPLGLVNASVWGEYVNASVSGLNHGISELTWTLQNEFDAGKNVSGAVSTGNGNDPIALYESLGSIAFGALALIPPLWFLAIPSLALAISSVGESALNSADVAIINNTNDPGSHSNYMLWQKFSVNGGSYSRDHNLPSNNIGNFTNYFTAQELLEFTINRANFGSTGKITLSATNMLSGLYSDPQVGGFAGASAKLVIPLLPALTLRGYATVNGSHKVGQPLLITQIDPNTGAVTHFYIKSKSLGLYTFFAKPQMSYEVQEILPHGLSAWNQTFNPIPYGATGTGWVNVSGSKTVIAGYVDNGGSTPISGAKVDLSGVGSSMKAMTNSNGYYAFYNTANTGTYTITASYNGNVARNTVDVTQLNGNTYTVPVLHVSSPAYTVTFTEAGLPTGSTWSVDFSGTTITASAGSSISFQAPYGSYSFSVASVYYNEYGYLPSPSSGKISVSNGNVQQVIGYRAVFLGF